MDPSNRAARRPRHSTHPDMVPGMVEAVVPARPRDNAVRTGLTMVVCAAILFGINGSVSKVVLLAGLPAQRLTELRSAGAFIGLARSCSVWAPQRLQMRRSEIKVLALYGIVGFAFVQWFYFVSIQRLPVGVALLIEYTAPLLVALWARFGEHEHVRPQVWWALALALFGLVLVAQVWDGLTLDRIGVLAGFLAAACSLAFYFVLGEKKVRTTGTRSRWYASRLASRRCSGRCSSRGGRSRGTLLGRADVAARQPQRHTRRPSGLLCLVHHRRRHDHPVRADDRRRSRTCPRRRSASLR